MKIVSYWLDWSSGNWHKLIDLKKLGKIGNSVLRKKTSVCNKAVVGAAGIKLKGEKCARKKLKKNI